MKNTPFSLVILCLVFAGCNQSQQKKSVAPIVQLNTVKPFIDPPVNGVNVPYTSYQVDAAKGDTLYYRSGSILLFPSNAFIDKAGNIVTGTVEIQYREFTNPVDYYLSGIPMDYDSAGVKYHFQSAGMCDIHAYKDGVPVYVNPKNKPEINLASSNDGQFNLYYLDSVTKNWLPKGASNVVNLNSNKGKHITAAQDDVDDTVPLIEPVKPEKANNKTPVIELVIDPASFKELLVYNNLKFQLDVSEKNFNPNDTSEEWNNIELEKGTVKGLYMVKFSNANKTVSYAARPVLEGKDYDKALAIFDKNNTLYQQRLKQRIAQQKIETEKNKKAFLKDSLENEQRAVENKKIEQLNLLIELRNKEIVVENMKVEAENKRIEKENRLIKEREKERIKLSQERASMSLEQLMKEQIRLDSIHRAKYGTGELLTDTLVRSFTIDGFGIFNADKIMTSRTIGLNCTFEDTKADTIDLQNTVMLYTSSNGLYRFNGNSVEISIDGDNMIVGTVGGRFAYISPIDFRKLNITSTTAEADIMMTIVDSSHNNYDYIRSIAKLK